jgi:predicted metal-binding membrane protein
MNNVAQAVVKRDRNIVLAGLAAVIFVASIYTIHMTGQFNRPMDVALMPSTHSAMTGGYSFLILFSMWAVMQVAMMSPTAVPMILMHGKIERHRQPQKLPFFRISLFFMGYIILWAIFSLEQSLAVRRNPHSRRLVPVYASETSLP